MDKPPNLGDFNLWYAVGSFFGTMGSMFHLAPKTKIEFFARLFISLVAGFFFGFVLLRILGWEETARSMAASGIFVSFFSYALIGMFYRLIEKADKVSAGKS